MKIYAFDVDETLEVSGGPIKFVDVVSLYNEGNIIGLCGNWALVTRTYPEQWHQVFCFLGPMLMTKAEFLVQLRTYVPADDYVMVGNDHLVFGASKDAEAANLAGWRFIREKDFAAGIR